MQTQSMYEKELEALKENHKRTLSEIEGSVSVTLPKRAKITGVFLCFTS